MNDDGHGAVLIRSMPWRIARMVLFAALLVSWLVWGPLGIVAYIGGLFNSLGAFIVMLILGVLIPVAAACLLVLGVFTALWWRRLTNREKRLRLILIAISAGFVTSFVLGLIGAAPSPFDMYVKGFARYAKSQADVEAIQNWLATLDPNEYLKKSGGDSTGIPVPPPEQPSAIARLHPSDGPYGVRVLPDDAGRLMVRLSWGGGLIGHWGIVVGHRETKVPPTQKPGSKRRQVNSRTKGLDEYGEYRKPLAPGAYVWAELE